RPLLPGGRAGDPRRAGRAVHAIGDVSARARGMRVSHGRGHRAHSLNAGCPPYAIVDRGPRRARLQLHVPQHTRRTGAGDSRNGEYKGTSEPVAQRLLDSSFVPAHAYSTSSSRAADDPHGSLPPGPPLIATAAVLTGLRRYPLAYLTSLTR